VGVIGLIEREWLETLSTVPSQQVRWEDYVAVGRAMALALREHDKVDIVIALTHMRVPNDERLAAEVGLCVVVALPEHASLFARHR
jgi:5'-nucleotidase